MGDWWDEHFTRIVVAAFATAFLAAVVILGQPMSPEDAAAAAAARDSLPPGAVLIYQNDHNDQDKRTIKIGDCYFTEVWDDRAWVLMNNGEGTVAVQCVGP